MTEKAWYEEDRAFTGNWIKDPSIILGKPTENPVDPFEVWDEAVRKMREHKDPKFDAVMQDIIANTLK